MLKKMLFMIILVMLLLAGCQKQPEEPTVTESMEEDKSEVKYQLVTPKPVEYDIEDDTYAYEELEKKLQEIAKDVEKRKIAE